MRNMVLGRFHILSTSVHARELVVLVSLLLPLLQHGCRRLQQNAALQAAAAACLERDAAAAMLQCMRQCMQQRIC
jgi:hypothetical protein